MSAIAGLFGKLYYKIGGQGGGGSWVELDLVGDVKVGFKLQRAEATVRRNNGFATGLVTLADMKFEFNLQYDATDAGFIAMRAAAYARTVVAFHAKTESGGTGPIADCQITGFDLDQGLTKAQEVAVVAEPTPTAIAPTWA